MSYQELLKIARRRNTFALWMTTVMAVTFGWLYAGKPGAFCGFALWLGAVVMPRVMDVRPFGFLQRNFMQAEQLPWTAVNVVLATLCGYMIWGIDAPFYVALFGVPVVVLTLTLTALDLDPQPDITDDPSRQD